MTANASGAATPPRVQFRDLCALFCCPPFPSAIVSKLAFMPPEPSYKIIESESGHRTFFQLIDGRVEWPHGADELRNIEVFFTRTPKRHFWSRKSNRIACMFVSPCGPAAHFTLLYSHANAVDLGQMCSFYYGLGYTLGCNVFGYDYSGYGCSSGRPSERGMYNDIRAALDALKERYQIPPEKVILYGHSIGTVPSVDVASSNSNIAALILHSPLMSGMRVAFPDTQRTWCCDAFPSIEKIPRVQCPTLVMHGTDDDVVDFSHGVSIYDKCPSSVEPLWVRGAGHNDIELHPAYLDRLRSFIDSEVLKKPVPSSRTTTEGNRLADGADATQRPSKTATAVRNTARVSNDESTPSSSRAGDQPRMLEATGNAETDIAILAESGAGKIEGDKSTTLSWLRSKLRSDSSG